MFRVEVALNWGKQRQKMRDLGLVYLKLTYQSSWKKKKNQDHVLLPHFKCNRQNYILEWEGWNQSTKTAKCITGLFLVL